VPGADPLGAADARGADCVQVFLSNPQSWKTPRPRSDTEALRTSGLPLYVHAPYLVNVASPNNRVRVPSRRILAETCAAAGEVGAAGVVVHGGYVTSGAELEEGRANWRKALERVETPVPLLIENTAGGERAVARHRDSIARLWEAVDGFDVRLCFDTCHAHAAGEDPAVMAEALCEFVGDVELVHLNDSKDPRGSGRDRHESLGAGQIEPEGLVEAVRVCAAPVICETPGDAEAQRADLAWLRARLERTAQRR
jgi:deoxyribonuclease-4